MHYLGCSDKKLMIEIRIRFHTRILKIDVSLKPLTNALKFEHSATVLLKAERT